MPTYTVVAGDSWAKIAGKVYGDQRMFAELEAANNSRALRPGMKIDVPDQQKDPFVSDARMAQAKAQDAAHKAGTPISDATYAANLARDLAGPVKPIAPTGAGYLNVQQRDDLAMADVAPRGVTSFQAERARLAQAQSIHADRSDKMNAPAVEQNRWDKMNDPFAAPARLSPELQARVDSGELQHLGIETRGPTKEVLEARRLQDLARKAATYEGRFDKMNRVPRTPAEWAAMSPAQLSREFGMQEGALLYQGFHPSLNEQRQASHDRAWNDLVHTWDVVSTGAGHALTLIRVGFVAGAFRPDWMQSPAYEEWLRKVNNRTMPSPFTPGYAGLSTQEAYQKWLLTPAAQGLDTLGPGSAELFRQAMIDIVPGLDAASGNPFVAPAGTALRNPEELQFDTTIANLRAAGEEIPGSWRGPGGYRRWFMEKHATQYDETVQRDLKYAHSASIENQMEIFLFGQEATGGRRVIEAGDTSFLPQWIDTENAFVLMANASQNQGKLGKEIRAQLEEWGMEMPYEKVLNPETGKMEWQEIPQAMHDAMDAYGYNWDNTMKGLGSGRWVLRGQWTATGGANYDFPKSRYRGGGGGRGGYGDGYERAVNIDPWNWSIRIT